MSLWSDYLNEREGKEVIEHDSGFAVFKLNEDETCYLEHIYVAPEVRGTGLASELADRVAKRARESGKSVLLGSVMPGATGATHSLKTQLTYGFKLDSIQGNLIVMSKEI